MKVICDSFGKIIIYEQNELKSIQVKENVFNQLKYFERVTSTHFKIDSTNSTEWKNIIESPSLLWNWPVSPA